MAHRVTQNWLVGLTRYPAIVQRFPFLNTLAHKYRVTDASCTSCGQKAVVKQFGNNINEAAKILATIPATEINEFKRMTKVDQLQISYMDTRGVAQTVTR